MFLQVAACGCCAEGTTEGSRVVAEPVQSLRRRRARAAAPRGRPALRAQAWATGGLGPALPCSWAWAQRILLRRWLTLLRPVCFCKRSQIRRSRREKSADASAERRRFLVAAALVRPLFPHSTLACVCIRSRCASTQPLWRPFSLPPRTAPPQRVFAPPVSQARGCSAQTARARNGDVHEGGDQGGQRPGDSGRSERDGGGQPVPGRGQHRHLVRPVLEPPRSCGDAQAPVGLRRSTHQPSGFLFPSSPPQPFTYSSGTGGVIKGCASPRRTAPPPPSAISLTASGAQGTTASAP